MFYAVDPSTTQSLTSTDGIFWRDNVCYRGGDGYHRSFNGALRQIWTLFAGDWWWFYQETVGFSMVNHRWDVVDAAGDGYHWTFSFRWNCDGLNCTIRP